VIDHDPHGSIVSPRQACGHQQAMP
jgi:hypothetical protein